MKKMQCEVCGSTEIKKSSDEIFECQSCGVQYSKTDVQKLLVEITGRVKIDKDDQTKNLYILARNDIDKPDGNALKYYEAILLEEPTSWEANFFVGYLKAWNCTMGELRSASSRYYTHLDSVLSLIKNTLDGEELLNALEVIDFRSKKIHDSFVNAAKRRFEKAVSKNPIVYKNGVEGMYEVRCKKANILKSATYEWYRDCSAIYFIMAEYGNSLKIHFPDNSKSKEYMLSAWKIFVTEYSELADKSREPVLQENAKEYVSKIKNYEPEYVVEYMPDSATNSSDENNVVPKKKAEDYICMFGKLSLTPWTFIVGILSLFFVKKAKEENGNVLSKNAKKWLIISVIGFALWLLFFLFMYENI